MREVQIYIGSQRIDLFKDESIEITSTIQDARDISKVFTDYSASFTIPASAVNNKVFKHFYNINIVTGGFDGRKFHEATIYLNHILFKRGRIVLNSVSMKNQKVFSYTIGFYGNTITLKDILGEDKLQALDFSDYDHTFTTANIKSIFKSGLTVDSTDEALIYPLITSKKRLFYNSSIIDVSNDNFNGNLYHTTESSPSDPKRYRKRGVNEIDLKPAIKLHKIIELIESNYNNIEFTSDSFFKSTNTAMSNLYMWMSNNKGNLFGDGVEFRKILSNYAMVQDDPTIVSVLDEVIYLGLGGINNFAGVDGKAVWVVRVNAVDVGLAGTPYTINLISDIDGETKSLDATASKNFFFNVTDKPNFRRCKIELVSEAATTYTIQVKVEYFPTGEGSFDEVIFNAENGGNISAVQDLAIKDNLPDIKIIDLLTGLFKMFNLTAYYIDDETSVDYGKIRVITLDEYYDDAVNNQSKGTIDVTKYIDTNSHTVSTSFPFSDINFKFSEDETLLIEQHNDIFGEIYGNSHLPVSKLYPEMITGEVYDIELPFSHLKYERLINEGTNAETEIQWGYAAGGNFTSKERSPYLNYDSEVAEHKPSEGDYEPIKLKPLLFYGIKKTALTAKINFSARDFSESEAVDSYFMPSNSSVNPTANTPAPFTLNFDAEIDEFFSEEDFGVDTNSLFNKFYKEYITSVFDPTKRIFKFSAFLPPSFLINYRLNDQLKIQDVVYRINSITTDVTTGRSTLELINLTTDEIV